MKVNIAPDKLLHFAVGGGCTLVGIWLALLARHFGASASPLWSGLLVCFLAAVAREGWNQQRGGVFDWRDIAATVLGSVPVLAAFWTGAPR